MDPTTAAAGDVIISTMAPLGVGGVLAGVMFWFYRKDSKGTNEILMRVVQENTRVCQELVTLIQERLPRH